MATKLESVEYQLERDTRKSRSGSGSCPVSLLEVVLGLEPTQFETSWVVVQGLGPARQAEVFGYFKTNGS